MVVCLCKGVSDKKIRWLVQNGAANVRAVMATCQAGSDCGTCLCQIKELIQKTQEEAAATETPNSGTAG